MPVPHKECMIGFALQAGGQGVPEATADVVFMLPEGADFPQWNRNIEFFEMNAGNYQLTHYFSAGEWLTGTINIPWSPGMMVSAAPLIKQWCFDRDGTNYNDSYWATFFVYFGQGHYLIFSDVKCNGGRFNVSFPSMVWMEVDVTGIAAPVDGAAGNFTGVTRLTAQPYTYANTRISLAYGGALAADNYTKDQTIEWTNLLLEPSDAGTLNNSPTPSLLPATGQSQWSGRFDQIFQTTTIWDAFLATTECSLEMRVQRAGVATGTLTFPRIIYTNPNLVVPGDGVVEQSPDWQALGGVGGAAAYTFLETV